jgi:hypothetical protein
MIGRLKILLSALPLEGYIWIAALIFLAFVNADSTHLTLCPFHNLGIDFCPGCGLGRSIHYLLHFEFVKSFHTHPLGGFALIVILHRIFTLIKNSLKYPEENLSY